ncbi:MAG: hypothetical protein ACRD88_00755 [Terriglobia bacterium]
MRAYLFIRRTVLVASLALIPWIPALSAQAADQLPGAGIPEIMEAQPASDHNAPTTVVAPAQSTWIDEISNSLGIYKVNYPTSDFAPYLIKLNLVRDAVGRGDRRAVKIEMGAFFKMLAKRDHGISEVAADELTNFAQMVTPLEEYGISVPRSGAGQ